MPNDCDVCPTVFNPLQTLSVQGGLADVGCSCLCGDVNNSCTVSAADAQDIQISILPQLGAQPGCYQLGNPDDQGVCGLSGVSGREVRGCDANGSGACSAADAQTIQLGLPGICPGCPPPPPGAYDPRNCAQVTPDTCGPDAALCPNSP